MTVLSWEHRLCDLVQPPKVASGFDAFVDGFIGSFRGSLSQLKRDAAQVETFADEYRALADADLRQRLSEFRLRFRRPRYQSSILLEALAAVREAAGRQLGMRPFTVQLLGALALHRGLLAEMATGEGKSLTAALAAVLAAWNGRPCHIITVNDYLAERDAERFQSLFEFCGLKAGFVTGPMSPRQRALGHAADVTYTTSKEIVADFLRDRLALGDLQHSGRWSVRLLWKPDSPARQGVVMRGLHTAIVDEADSVLIDEAVTPLIIAGTDGNDRSEVAYQATWNFVSRLTPGLDYRVDPRYREIELLPPGLKRVEGFGASLPGVWRASNRRQELVEQALSAREFFHHGKQYVVEDGKVVIVDEFTGRLMPMRKWRHGIHQSIEAKEGVEISPLDETLARMSFQRFFRLFRHLSGMTGTAQDAASEFWTIYRLPVVSIPPNRTCQRIDLPDRIFPDEHTKFVAILEEIKRIHSTGRPVLIGTRDISGSEALADALRLLKLEFSLLNATRHREEAEIISRAGEYGRITIATNMAGRGTDIELAAGIAVLGGLHVIATERHESRRVDRQLYGRAGRQGDPGSAQAFVSVKDTLLTTYLGSTLRHILERLVGSKLLLNQPLAISAFSFAQRLARKRAFQQRRDVLQQDSWMAEALSFAEAPKG